MKDLLLCSSKAVVAMNIFNIETLLEEVCFFII